MRSRSLAALALLVAVALLPVGCSSSAPGSNTEKVTLTVSAAASLKKSFTALAEQFSADNPDIEVEFNFDGSQALVTQIDQGANVDVLATADEKNMRKLGDKITDPRIFATNVLTIVTQPGNPENIQGLADLTKSDVTTVICAVDVPCGSATAEVEKDAGVDIKPVSEETAVTGVLTKVQTKQADAGLVYVTDAAGAGDTVTSVSDPAFAAVVNKYPIGVVAATKNKEAAQQFVDMVLGTKGSSLLESQGFGPAT
ncbi:MAG: molybdate ABC transporter substrate-binding protein [Gordonia sp.]|nr:molybdate ABC transporter substrate-binding protein [Gordonia sp. (in: high G+C Gram-positive bacteria)]